MFKILVIAFMSLIYGGLFCFIYHKYKDCKANPRKYNEIPNFEEYRYSIWYYNPKKFYGKGSLVEHGIPFAFFLCFGYVFYYSITICLYESLAAKMHDVVFIYLINILWPFSTGVVLIAAFFIADVYLMLSERPKNICYVQSHLCIHSRRSEIFKERCIFALISVVALALLRVGFNSEFGYVDGNTLVRMPLFSLSEQVYELDDLADVRITYDYKGEVDEYILVNEKGQRFDIAKYGYFGYFEDEEVTLHEYVEPIISEQNYTLSDLS